MARSERVLSEDEIKKLHEVELELLDVLMSVCDQAGIMWFADGGTMLGALRHQGFIPWDDDIDVTMLRDDFHRFIEVAPDLLPAEFSLLTPYTTPNYSSLIVKLCKNTTRFMPQEFVDAGIEMGIYLDIFPLDNTSTVPTIKNKQKRMTRFHALAFYLYTSKNVVLPHGGFLGFLERMACTLAHHVLRVFYSPEKGVRAFDRYCTLDRSTGTTSDDLVCWGGQQNIVFSQDVYLPPSTATFEGRSISMPNKPVEYLEKMYGDWQTIPSEESRKTHAPVVLEFDTTQ
ncbi:MAG: LicD family protein [Propionibacteriaceae bacterium]|jgi:lipopolysaccharide cholinephosphotransferase|nr:LicD family protein [Propionibacteriaceae bacterium]